MPKPRAGFAGRVVELPNEVWAALESLSVTGGVGVQVLIEDAAKRYTARPPKALPQPRKRGPKKKEERGEGKRRRPPGDT